MTATNWLSNVEICKDKRVSNYETVYKRIQGPEKFDHKFYKKIYFNYF